MSLISSFIQTQLLKALEDQFVAHEGDLKDAFVAEVDAFAKEVLQWVESKVQAKAAE
jgi:hypothetical protein